MLFVLRVERKERDRSIVLLGKGLAQSRWQHPLHCHEPGRLGSVHKNARISPELSRCPWRSKRCSTHPTDLEVTSLGRENSFLTTSLACWIIKSYSWRYEGNLISHRFCLVPSQWMFSAAQNGTKNQSISHKFLQTKLNPPIRFWKAREN